MVAIEKRFPIHDMPRPMYDNVVSANSWISDGNWRGKGNHISLTITYYRRIISLSMGSSTPDRFFAKGSLQNKGTKEEFFNWNGEKVNDHFEISTDWKKDVLSRNQSQPFWMLTKILVEHKRDWYHVYTRHIYHRKIVLQLYCVTFSIVKWHLSHVNVSRVNTAWVSHWSEINNMLLSENSLISIITSGSGSSCINTPKWVKWSQVHSVWVAFELDTEHPSSFQLPPISFLLTYE